MIWCHFNNFCYIQMTPKMYQMMCLRFPEIWDLKLLAKFELEDYKKLPADVFKISWNSRFDTSLGISVTCRWYPKSTNRYVWSILKFATWCQFLKIVVTCRWCTKSIKRYVWKIQKFTIWCHFKNLSYMQMVQKIY